MRARTWTAALVCVVLALAASDAGAARPASSLKLPSAQGFPLLVHGPAGSSALLVRVRDAADRAWRAEIVELGWAPPPPDRGGPDARFDIYIDPALAAGEAYVMPEDDVPATPWDDSTSYMGLPTRFADDADLFSTVAHELNHASQFALDSKEDDAFFEHTAVFVEQRVANHLPTYGVGIGDFQSHPERALTYMGQDQYEYGAALWLMYLSETLGDGGHALPQRLWQETRQLGGGNRPHFLDGLDKILAERGWTRGRFFAGFAAWRTFTGRRDDRHHFVAGADWGDASQIAVEPHEAAFTANALLGAFGAEIHELAVDARSGAVEAQLGGGEAALALVPLDATGVALAAPAFVEGVVPGRLPLPPGTARVLLALTYAPAAYDPAARDFRKHAVSLTARAIAAGPTTPSPGPMQPGPAPAALAPESPSGGCAMAGGAGPIAPLWILASALLVRARRRPR